MEFRLPYDVFPGIFSSIDAYTKRMVHGWFDEHGSAPKWLDGMGDLTGYEDPPHWTKFKVVDERHNILLRGTLRVGLFSYQHEIGYAIANLLTNRGMPVQPGAQDQTD